MTRDQQMRAALKVLAAPRDQLGAYKEEIDDALNIVEVEVTNDGSKEWVTKKTKGKLRSFRAALRRVQAAHNALPAQVKFFAFRDLDFEKQIAVCDRLLAKPSGQPKRAATKQRLAAREARGLLMRYGHKVSVTRGGKWCELAAILYGDEMADLYHHCCAAKKDRNRG
jgi:hypothetical protein